MTLLLREVAGFLTGAGLWLLTMAAIAVASSGAVLLPATGRPDPRHLGAAIVSGALLAALIHRLGAALIWVPRVGGRELPVVWVAIGAAASALVVAWRRRAIT